MSRDKRDIRILGKIVGYCDGIARCVNRFGSGVEALRADRDYMDSVAMKVLQIGELTTHLSDSFKATNNEVPWQSVKSMRNFAAHEYENFDVKTLWNTISKNIPALREYCQRIIEQSKDAQ